MDTKGKKFVMSAEESFVDLAPLDSMPVENTGSLAMVPLEDMQIYENNARLSLHGFAITSAAQEDEKAADAEIERSFRERVASGLPAWNPEHPARVMLPDGEKKYKRGIKVVILQGNRRVATHHRMQLPAADIPCIVVPFDPDNILATLNDGETGKLSKSIADVTYGVALLFRAKHKQGIKNFGRTAMAELLFHKDRRALDMVCKTKGLATLEEVKKKTGNLQEIQYVSELPEPIFKVWCEELAAGVPPKNAKITKDMIFQLRVDYQRGASDKELIEKMNTGHARRLAEKEEAEAVAQGRKPPKHYGAIQMIKILAEQELKEGSILARLVALTVRPEKEVERNAVEELALLVKENNK